MTFKQNEKYLAAGGIICPVCGSEDIESTSRLESGNGIAWQYRVCNTCDQTWSDEYKLTGFSLS